MKLTITTTVPQAKNLNFSLLLTYTYPINHNSNPKHLSKTCTFPATLLVHETVISSRWLEQPANIDLQDPSCSGLHPSLASLLNLVLSIPPLCRPVTLNYLLYSMVTSCFIFFPLSKNISLSKYFLPFHANVHSFVRSQLRCYFLRMCSLAPTRPQSEWGTLPPASWDLPKHLVPPPS